MGGQCLSKSLEDLKPEVAQKARAFLTDANEYLDPHDLEVHTGERAIITSTLRSDIEQLANFAQGKSQLRVVNAARMMAGMKSLAKSENEYSISECDGQIDKSKHQAGDAFDYVILGGDGKPVWRLIDKDGKPIAEYIEKYKKLGDIAKGHGLRSGIDFKPINPVTGIGWDPFHAEL
jgi:hypothetical protein